MQEDQITRYLSTHPESKFSFRATCSMDELMHFKPPREGLFVVNTDKRNASGTHWLVVYRQGKKKAIYFDSFGYRPHHAEIGKFFAGSPSVVYNSRALQSMRANTCGYYCILAALHFARGRTLRQFRALFNEKKKNTNDTLVKQLVRHEFRRIPPLCSHRPTTTTNGTI